MEILDEDVPGLFSEALPNEISVEQNDEEENELTSKPATKKIIPKTNKPKSDRLVNLPLSRIKQIMKMDPDVHLASSEAVFLITKCTELFVQTLTKESYVFTASSKKKTVQRRDVDSAINNIETLCFLEGAMDD